MKLNALIYTFIALLSSTLLLAQPGGSPPNPGGGAGGVGPGSPAAPIDAYIFLLVIVGFVLFFNYAKNYLRKA